MAQETIPQDGASQPKQAITGLTPPLVREARIREEWPTALGISPALVSVSRRLVQSVIGLPLALPMLGLLFALKIGPLVCRRYTLTNRRLMIQKGWKPAPVQQIPLADIEDVRLAGAVDPFYLAGTLEVISKGQVAMTLPGCPEPEGFRQAILNAITAWVPGKTMGHFQPASAVKGETPAK